GVAPGVGLTSVVTGGGVWGGFGLTSVVSGAWVWGGRGLTSVVSGAWVWGGRGLTSVVSGGLSDGPSVGGGLTASATSGLIATRMGALQTAACATAPQRMNRRRESPG
ncbi:MAG: hypothetical protein M3N52_02300, partial [Actinomycetota bacterium]|nr:hypothetical protein [Actinomycetota bacterium]